MKKEKIFFWTGLLMLLITILQFSMIFDSSLDWEKDGNPLQGTIIFGFLTIIFLFLSRKYISKLLSNNQQDKEIFYDESPIKSYEKKNIDSVENFKKSVIEAENIIQKKYELPSLNLISENSDEFKKAITVMEEDQLSVIIGKQKDKFIFESIKKFPNMLIGGTITTGKTSFLNTIICNLLMKESPQNLKLVLIDSKRVDYSVYKGIPHLLCPVITDSKKASLVLQRMCSEINSRYKILLESGVKNIDVYNKKADQTIPNIVIVIDELTNILNDELILNIEKIAQNGWNVGVHLIVVVNHPSSKIISTIAKTNFPTRIAFRTTSMSDSRMIIDSNGAEKLSGVGNVLYSSIQNSEIINLETILIDDNDILSIVNYVCEQQSVNYETSFKSKDEIVSEYDDPMYNEVVEFAIHSGKISASLIQRRFRIGYNRATRLIDLLEERGIISPANGSKPREVLVKLED